MHVGVVLGDIEPQSGGGFTFVHDVVDAFINLAGKSSHRFTLLAPQAYADAVRGRKLADNVAIVPVRKPFFLDRPLSLLRHYWPVFGYFWRRPSRLEQQAASLGIDVIWLAGGTHDTYEIPYVTMVWDVQHLTHPWFPEVSANWTWDHRELFFRRHLRRATAVIVGTRIGRDELIRYFGVPEEHIAILPHPTPGFALRAAGDAASAKPPVSVPKDYIFYPAQFWPHKNHVNLLRALQLLIKADSDAPALVLVGSDKGNRAFVERCAADLGISHKVIFPGFVSNEELIGLYRNARALVYPSFSGPENLPPLEAFALGCPAIVSNYKGAEEQLGDAAVLFDPTDPVAIAQAIGRVLEDDALRAELIERGRVRAAKWTGREFVSGIFDVLDAFEAQRRCWK
ncbi:glycosyltransferase family 4 protein [Bradyrhizobium lablabi]|uniref:glycosyltransferase family 4 protein n=1 Tax=Bradyrhizobium lablabi TaxID=722472 RepID=UPI001BA8BB0D|nr:glycosyltransferase family 1 protein [Bradyrhizobium lablabi]MBR1120154.1 glycosyltransferase family 4 protein [Bradyrhizobium lablabi]